MLWPVLCMTMVCSCLTVHGTAPSPPPELAKILKIVELPTVMFIDNQSHSTKIKTDENIRASRDINDDDVDDDDGENSGSTNCDVLLCSINETCGQDGCICKSGYLNNTDEGNCIDTDECAASIHPCGDNFECVNGIGGYDCICNGELNANVIGTQICTSITTTKNGNVSSASNEDAAITTKVAYIVLGVAILICITSVGIIAFGIQYIKQLHRRNTDILQLKSDENDIFSLDSRTEDTCSRSSISPEVLNVMPRRNSISPEAFNVIPRRNSKILVSSQNQNQSLQSLQWDPAQSTKEQNISGCWIQSTQHQREIGFATSYAGYETPILQGTGNASGSTNSEILTKVIADVAEFLNQSDARRQGGDGGNQNGNTPLNESTSSIPSVYRLLRDVRETPNDGMYAHRGQQLPKSGGMPDTNQTQRPASTVVYSKNDGTHEQHYEAPVCRAPLMPQEEANTYDQFMSLIQKAANEFEQKMNWNGNGSPHKYERIGSATSSMTPSAANTPVVGFQMHTSADDHTYTTPEKDVHLSPLPVPTLHDSTPLNKSVSP